MLTRSTGAPSIRNSTAIARREYRPYNGRMNATLQSRLAEAMQRARAGRLDAASDRLEAVLRDAGDHPDTLQLLGLVRRQQQRPADAEALLRRSLALVPDQPHVCNNLGNVLSDLGRTTAAIEQYRAACRLQPDYPEAEHNLGLAQLDAGDPAGALETVDRLLVRRPGAADPYVTRGNALRALGRTDAAEAAYRQALEIDARQVNALHNLGVLCRQLGRTDEALRHLEAAARCDPRRPEVHGSRGHALLDAGRIDDAINAYGIAIQLKPDDVAAHDALNKIMWQHGRTDGYLSSYAWAVQRAPQVAQLWADWADKLVLAGRSDEAARALRHAIDNGHDAPSVHHRLGRALAVLGYADDAARAFTRAVEEAPAEPRFLMDLARLHIVESRYAEAETLLERALASAPLNQEALAYRGVCWRLRDDPREAGLNDYRNLVREYRLPPPPGYASIEAFNRALADALLKLHRTREAPAEQTLRGGTQTLDDLFDAPAPEIAALRVQLEAAITDYIERLPGHADHPLGSRRAGAFAFSGAWSVCLRAGGFHVNHVHPEGWISSCYYVDVPPAVHRDNGHEGWLQFGETSLRLGEREHVACRVRPEPGLLVLFPSYFFHGTVPFNDEARRLTVAFDVVPA